MMKHRSSSLSWLIITLLSLSPALAVTVPSKLMAHPNGAPCLSGPPAAGDSIYLCALKVLLEPDAEAKAAHTAAAFELWSDGLITDASPSVYFGLTPSRPARDGAKVKLMPPNQLRKRGRGGSLQSRQALLHSLVHIECSAIDLAWDIIARYGTDPAYAAVLPRAFLDDFIRVAADEARHFTLLLERLRAVGSDYGQLAAHDGLWESAAATSGSLPARLAVEHCTHEARGLDVLPQTIARFRAGGDAATADLLENVIYAEEISHCAAGVRWLRFLHEQAHASAAAVPAEGAGASGAAWAAEASKFASVEEWFHALVRSGFHGPLKPPFNAAARAQAGFGPGWYLPLAATVTSA